MVKTALNVAQHTTNPDLPTVASAHVADDETEFWMMGRFVASGAAFNPFDGLFYRTKFTRESPCPNAAIASVLAIYHVNGYPSSRIGTGPSASQLDPSVGVWYFYNAI